MNAANAANAAATASLAPSDTALERRGHHSKPLNIFILHASPLLTNHLAHGDGLVAWGFIEELARRGHQLYVAAPQIDVSGEVPANVALVQIDALARSPVLKYLRYIRRVRRLYRDIARRQRIDVVHQMNPVVRGLSLGMVGIRPPLVLGTYVGDWLHHNHSGVGVPPLDARARAVNAVKAALDALQQRFASRLMLATPFARNRVPLTWGITGKITYLHHGIDVAAYSPTRSASDPDPRPVSVLFLSRVEIHKGIDTVVEAFRNVLLTLPTARLIIAGDGSLLPRLRTAAAAEPWGTRVEFLGPVSRNEVAAWMRVCTVFCQASYGEPYGQTILEAMACGKPVVLARAGGASYLLPEQGGLCFTPGDAGELADKLVKILSEPERALNMGRINRETIVARNSWPVVVDALEDIYRSAIQSSRRGRNRVR